MIFIFNGKQTAPTYKGRLVKFVIILDDRYKWEHLIDQTWQQASAKKWNEMRFERSED